MPDPEPSSRPPAVVYLVQRHDYGPHYSDEVARGRVHSIHTTKAAANRKAKVLVRVIRRDEDTNDMAILETEEIDKKGYYFAYLELNQDMADDGIHHTEVTTSKMVVRDESESPYSDEEDEDEFADSVDGEFYWEDKAAAEDGEEEEQLEDTESASAEGEAERARKRRRLQADYNSV